MVGFKLLYLELWLVNNDNFITLSTFFHTEGKPTYARVAREFYQASVDACAEGDGRCVAYSGALHLQQTYARPIVAFFGSRLADSALHASATRFLDAITVAMVGQVAVSTVVLGFLAAVLLAALPASLGAFVADGLAVFGIAAYWLPEQAAFGAIQPMLGVSWGGAAVVTALAGAVLGLAWTRAWPATGRPADPRIVSICWWAAIGLLAARAIAYAAGPAYFWGQIPGAGVGVLPLVLALGGLAVFAASIRAAGREARARPAVTLLSALLLLAFVSTGENFFSTAFHIAPRGPVSVEPATPVRETPRHPTR